MNRKKRIDFGKAELEGYADWLACDPTLVMDCAAFVWIRSYTGECHVGWNLADGSIVDD